jgi:hypothetical protein
LWVHFCSGWCSQSASFAAAPVGGLVAVEHLERQQAQPQLAEDHHRRHYRAASVAAAIVAHKGYKRYQNLKNKSRREKKKKFLYTSNATILVRQLTTKIPTSLLCYLDTLLVMSLRGQLNMNSLSLLLALNYKVKKKKRIIITKRQQNQLSTAQDVH